MTPKQRQALDFIEDFIAKSKKAPTTIEIMDGLKLNYLRSVSQYLNALEKKGFIKRDRFQQRSITLLDSNSISPFNDTVQVPVIASAGCDTAEVYAQEDFSEYIAVDKSLIDPRRDIVAVKAVGNSMIDAGIKNGDYVLVEVTENVSSGDRVVAIVGEMAVIKRLQQSDRMSVLYPEARGYQPIVMSRDNSKIFGKVLSVIPADTQKSDDVKIEPVISWDGI